MTEPTARDGLTDPDAALRREVEVLAQRFPEVDPSEIDGRVHETYDDLKQGATVQSHLVALTEGSVTDDLRQAAAERDDRVNDAD